MEKKSLISLTVILIVIIIAVIILTRSPSGASEEEAKCIGENSVLYAQLGCHACEIQEKMFGNNYEFLSIVDCFFERDKCIEKGIPGTPTWIINGEKYPSVRSIDELKELTGC